MCRHNEGAIDALAAPNRVTRSAGRVDNADPNRHEVRPAYLQIDEVAPGRYRLLWRTPVLSGMRLPVVLRLPDDIHDVTAPAIQELPDSLVERRVVDASGQGLGGKRIEFVGLQATVPDVLVRVQMLDGAHSSTLVLHPDRGSRSRRRGGL
jgi:hypothetical protein